MDIDDLPAEVSQDFGGRQAPPLYAPLLRLVVRGEPVSVDDLAESTGIPVGEVRQALAGLPDLETDGQGRVVGYGLTLRPTPHRFMVGGQQLLHVVRARHPRLAGPPRTGGEHRVSLPRYRDTSTSHRRPRSRSDQRRPLRGARVDRHPRPTHQHPGGVLQPGPLLRLPPGRATLARRAPRHDRAPRRRCPPARTDTAPCTARPHHAPRLLLSADPAGRPTPRSPFGTTASLLEAEPTEKR